MDGPVPLYAIRTALTFRQAIWRKEDANWQVCGIPDSFYTDNGSDFISKHMEQVSADLKIRLIFSFPGQPRGRGRIERFFETVAKMFLPTLPGYSPPGSKAQKATLTLPELDARFKAFLLTVYHQREHSETKARPKERWERGGFLPRMPESLEQLDLLLLTVPRARKVHSDGIRFHGLRYVDPTLAAYVGEQVMLRYDPRDMAEIRVFHQGSFLCRAICPEQVFCFLHNVLSEEGLSEECDKGESYCELHILLVPHSGGLLRSDQRGIKVHNQLG